MKRVGPDKPMYKFAYSIVLLVFPALAADPETVKFRLEPAVGSAYEAATTHTREVDLGEGKRVDKSVGKVKFFVDKHADEYRLKATTVETRIERDGQPILSPMLTANIGVELIYEFDSDGKLTTIRGYEGILEQLKKMLPAPFVTQMTPLFNSEGLRKRDIANWDARGGHLLGKEVKIGDVETKTEPFALPTRGTVQTNVETTYAGWVDCGSARCVRIEYKYSTNEEAQAKLTGKGEKIIDPTTLRVYSETSVKRLSGELEVPNKGKRQVSLVETQEYKTSTL